jgi:hypothetical protein
MAISLIVGECCIMHRIMFENEVEKKRREAIPLSKTMLLCYGVGNISVDAEIDVVGGE